MFFAGYLAVSLFLNESHELLLLLVNTVLKVGFVFSLTKLVICVPRMTSSCSRYFLGSSEHQPY